MNRSALPSRVGRSGKSAVTKARRKRREKKQLIERMVEHTDSPKREAAKHLEAFTLAVSEALKAGEEVQLAGFGKFYVREQKAREGKNPQTGETIHMEARKVPAFKAGKAFKESV